MAFLKEKNLISELPEPLFQSEVLYEAIDMKILFSSSSKWNHYHKKGFAPSLVLKMRVFTVNPLTF